MAQVNHHYLKLAAGYLFPEIARRVSTFSADNPDAPIIKLGIGDVTEPLPAAIREAMHQAVDEMGIDNDLTEFDDPAEYGTSEDEDSFDWMMAAVKASIGEGEPRNDG